MTTATKRMLTMGDDKEQVHFKRGEFIRHKVTSKDGVSTVTVIGTGCCGGSDDLETNLKSQQVALCDHQ
jgi:hypothetical protein